MVTYLIESRKDWPEWPWIPFYQIADQFEGNNHWCQTFIPLPFLLWIAFFAFLDAHHLWTGHLLILLANCAHTVFSCLECDCFRCSSYLWARQVKEGREPGWKPNRSSPSSWTSHWPFLTGGSLGKGKFILALSRVDSQRRQWHPTPVLLPGTSHGRRSLVGCSPWGR